MNIEHPVPQIDKPIIPLFLVGSMAQCSTTWACRFGRLHLVLLLLQRTDLHDTKLERERKGV